MCRKFPALAFFCALVGLLLSGCGDEPNDPSGPRELPNRKNVVEDPFQAIATQYATAMDPTNPITRDFAASIAAKSAGEYNIGQICFIYDHVSNRWRYVNDPRGVDYVSPASRTIEADLVGDCDDFAVLMASLIEAIGGQGRVVVAFSAESGHAYAEVYMGKDENTKNRALDGLNSHYQGFFDWLFGVRPIKDAGFHVDAQGRHWMNLDWTAKHAGGPLFDALTEIAIYPNGSYEVLMIP